MTRYKLQVSWRERERERADRFISVRVRGSDNIMFSLPNMFNACDTFCFAAELILTADPEQEFSVRSTANLRCFADSIPAPRITWLRIVNGNEEELVEQRSGNPDFGTYTIQNVEESDAGTYRCRARNSLVPGKDVDIELIVLGECDCFLIKK